MTATHACCKVFLGVLLLCVSQVRTLAELHDWEALDAYAAEAGGRKCPVIGWEPFLEAAKRHGAPRDIQAK